MASLSSYHFEVEVMPDGKWRTIDPDYVLFDDHIQAGLHACATCKCSYCREPSVFNMVKLRHATDGRECGVQMCRTCILLEREKFIMQKLYNK